MGSGSSIDVTPSARRLTDSLRDIGYDFVSALADIVDNSVSAGAARVEIEIEHAGDRSTVTIADDGLGMTEREVNEALRLGSRRGYSADDLGRFGLGLKTASLSQARRLTVVSRRSKQNRRITSRALDLDRVAATDRWMLYDPWDSSAVQRSLAWLDRSPGTVVVWENLDRILPAREPDGSWAKRKLQQLSERASEYLGMVFHRFLEGHGSRETLMIAVNGEKVLPWNPLAPDEVARAVLPDHRFEVAVDRTAEIVTLGSVVLPNREQFSSADAFERLGGPKRWNRQQGLYIYRAGRLIQSGGWNGIRAADEHTKLARASLDFPPALDGLFSVNVAKTRVSIPAEIRNLLERPIQELCRSAESAYRQASERRARPAAARMERPQGGAGMALRAAAMEVGEYEALQRIMERMRMRAPDALDALGW